MSQAEPPTVWFIRHAESEANAGARTESPETIGLSARGKQQASDLAAQFDRAPNLIVTSPYARTFFTAEPTMQRFSGCYRHEVWPVEEFTYLSPDHHINTTVAERMPHVESYWQRRDPDYRATSALESFNEVVARVDNVLKRAAEATEAFTAIFAHGTIMKIAFLRLTQPHLNPQELMGHFVNSSPIVPASNTAIMATRPVNGRLELVPLKMNWPQFPPA